MFLLLKIFGITFPVPEATKKRITHFLWFSLWKRKNATVVGTSKWGSELQYEERLQKWWISTTFWWRFNTNRWLELDFCQFKNVSKSELRCIFVEMIFRCSRRRMWSRAMHFWCLFSLFFEKAPRVDSNPRATSAVCLRAWGSGGYHSATAAVAG